MAVSTIPQSYPETIYITASTQLYNLTNTLPINRVYPIVVSSDVIDARLGRDATGHGWCVRLGSVVDMFLKVGTMFAELRVNASGVVRRAYVEATSF